VLSTINKKIHLFSIQGRYMDLQPWDYLTWV